MHAMKMGRAPPTNFRVPLLQCCAAGSRIATRTTRHVVPGWLIAFTVTAKFMKRVCLTTVIVSGDRARRIAKPSYRPKMKNRPT